jgi:hypothetical protein
MFLLCALSLWPEFAAAQTCPSGYPVSCGLYCCQAGQTCAGGLCHAGPGPAGEAAVPPSRTPRRLSTDSVNAKLIYLCFIAIPCLLCRLYYWRTAQRGAVPPPVVETPMTPMAPMHYPAITPVAVPNPVFGVVEAHAVGMKFCAACGTPGFTGFCRACGGVMP